MGKFLVFPNLRILSDSNIFFSLIVVNGRYVVRRNVGFGRCWKGVSIFVNSTPTKNLLRIKKSSFNQSLAYGKWGLNLGQFIDSYRVKNVN